MTELRVLVTSRVALGCEHAVIENFLSWACALCLLNGFSVLLIAFLVGGCTSTGE